MIDYWAYTGDTTYQATVTRAVAAQVGPDKNFIVPNHKDQEGNDDQAFWVCAALSGMELNHPAPSGTTWLGLAEAAFENIAARWDTTTCGGGLSWQIYADNVNGLDYKNSISNLGLFQIAARLARYTGKQEYADWAEKVWDWMTGVGLITDDYMIYDGTSRSKGCPKASGSALIEWTYNNGMAIYGAAAMYSLTGDQTWHDRVHGLLATGASRFFTPFPNATNVLYEVACEKNGMCNVDQKSFKGYLSRFWAKSAMLVPDIADKVTSLLQTSAEAAAESCSGGDDGVTCGQKWYVGGWDGTWGVGQQLTSMETIQALLVAQGGQPLVQDGVSLKGPGTPGHASAVSPSSTKAAAPKTTSAPKSTTSSAAPTYSTPKATSAAAKPDSSLAPHSTRPSKASALSTYTKPTSTVKKPVATDHSSTVVSTTKHPKATSTSITTDPKATGVPKSMYSTMGYIAKQIGHALSIMPEAFEHAFHSKPGKRY